MSRVRETAPLSRELVLRAALRILDERGTSGLTMRALGSELGVEAMSVYRHVPGKRAIEEGVVGLLVDELAASLEAGAVEREDWRDLLARFARIFRGVAIDHPGAFVLLAEQPTRAWMAARATSDASLARLLDAGFALDPAIAALRTVIRYVIGFSLAEVAGAAAQRDPDDPEALRREGLPLAARLVEAVAGEPRERLFDLGLTALLDGLEDLRGGPAPAR
jgi:AcrR family transcriptional regulator